MGYRTRRELNTYTVKEISEYKKKHGGRKPRKPRKNASKSTYNVYISSPAWIERKNKYYQTHAKQCTRCDSYDHIALHHTFYDRGLFGIEPDEHLVPLCQWCHSQYHKEYGTRKDMRLTTEYFIRKYKDPTIPPLQIGIMKKEKIMVEHLL